MIQQKRLQETRAARVAHARAIHESGEVLYPSSSKRTEDIATAIQQATDKAAADVTIAGRIRTLRKHGGTIFSDIEDSSGAVQLFLKKDAVDESRFACFSELIDIGDIIEVTGTPTTTKRGQPSLLVASFRMLAKSRQPLPEQHYGLTDVETRSRKRYLDLLANPETKSRFEKRSELIHALRSALERNHFMEVETPILQPIPGGANALPFITHHNVLDEDLYLRIAPELYLKRLIVGGFERVFEVARCFRNEGVDHDHNPEFTQIEAYAAYWDYTDMMRFIEKSVRDAVVKVTGGTVACDGATIDFKKHFATLKFSELLKEKTGIDLATLPTADDVYVVAKERGVDVEPAMGRGRMIDLIYKKFVRPHIIQPTFLIDHPADLSPLAKPKENDPTTAERFQLLIAGTEVSNGWSELNDPDLQKKRFEEQDALRKKGDDEAQRIDMDYIEALMVGMPPTAGVGIGIDRLAAIALGAPNLKEIIFFPVLRSQGSKEVK